MSTKDVRCAGCRKRLGYTTSATMHKVWCTDFSCASVPPAMAQQARDDYIRLAHATGATTVSVLAAKFQLSSARVHQIVAA